LFATSSYFDTDILLCEFQALVSSDKPRLNAFCRVAPSVRFNVRAMLAARFFLFACFFNVRTSAVGHTRRRFEFFAI